MIHDQIIKSLCRTDLYKLSMGLATPRDVEARYGYFNRGGTIFPLGFNEVLQDQVDAMANLQVTPAEIEFLRRRADFLGEYYLEWLQGYRFNPDEVRISQVGGDLKIVIEGPWYRTIYWEVPLMALIPELYFKMTNQQPKFGWLDHAINKAKTLYDAGVTWTDFGVRRAYSSFVHEQVLLHALAYLQSKDHVGGLVGTSCVSLAAKYDLRPIGTMAHEFIMAYGALKGPQIANQMAMDIWMKTYKGRLGTALPDTFTTDVFLRDFTHEYAKSFDGVRQDSGNPFEFANKIIAHYKKLGIDPLTKTIVFSDSLNVERMIEIHNFCKGKVGCSFGYGTGFTNDVGVKPLNMVIKLIAARETKSHPWLPAVKLSDDAGKVTNNEVAAAVKLLLAI